MSVSHVAEYSVVLKGSRNLLEQIPVVAKDLAKAYGSTPMAEKVEKNDFYLELNQNLIMKYQEMADWIVWNVQEAFESQSQKLSQELSRKESLLLCLDYFEEDSSCGIFDAFLDALDEQIPELAIAFSVVYQNSKYDREEQVSLLYSPEGKSLLHLKEFSGSLIYRRDSMPDEDWIPEGWRHFGKIPPAVKAKIDLHCLGPWEETAFQELENFVSHLSDILYCSSWKLYKNPEDKSLFLNASGLFPISILIQNFHFLLFNLWTDQGREIYQSWCADMRKKQKIIYLELDEHINPNTAWNYRDRQKWRFLISSDGYRLISKFTDFSLYASSHDHCQDNVSFLQIIMQLYQALTGKDLEDLEDPACFLVEQAILYTYLKYPCNLWDDADEDWNDEEPVFWIQSYIEKNREIFSTAVQNALKQAAAQPKSVRFFPESFDQRFAGKIFVIRGELDGYTTGEITSLIEQFGGVVYRNITPRTDYFIYGESAGEALQTALQYHIPILSVDYFEDFIR